MEEGGLLPSVPEGVERFARVCAERLLFGLGELELFAIGAGELSGLDQHNPSEGSDGAYGSREFVFEVVCFAVVIASVEGRGDRC